MMNDRDMDGIEDKFDSTFNTPEELLEKKGIKRIVTIEADEDMLKRLAQTDIPFFAQKNADGYKVLCDENRSLHRKMLTDTKSCVMREMKKE